MISKKTVTELIDERIAELDNGLFVVELSISSRNVINVELDKYEGNVSVKDCMSVSRNVEHNLDREEQDFELSVSSAGLDKGLRVFPQYKKNIGRTVKVNLVDEGKKEGVLSEVQEDLIVLEETIVEKEGKKKIKKQILTPIPFAKIVKTVVKISFKR